jgi:hypothetical protein
VPRVQLSADGMQAQSASENLRDDSSTQELFNILHAIGASSFLPEFIDDGQDDSCIEALSKLPLAKFARRYHMDQQLAEAFVEKCRMHVLSIASPVSNASSSDTTLSLSLHDDDERNRWLKACLVLEACIIGTLPFVGLVMQAVHNKIIENVKKSVADDLGAVEDRDWDCSLCGVDVDSKDFTEAGQVSLSIKSIDENGTVEAHAPHCLKPGSLQYCSWKKGTPADFVRETLSVSLEERLLLMPDASQADVPKSASFLLLRNQFKLGDSASTALNLFTVVCSSPRSPSREYLVALCASSPRQTANMLNASLAASPVSVDQASESPSSTPPRTVSDVSKFSAKSKPPLEYLFWTLARVGGVVVDAPHDLKSGSVVKFNGSNLPPSITQGALYVIVRPSQYSFCVLGPLVHPAAAVVILPTVPLCVVRQSPPARFRDAARLFHTKPKAEPHWSSIRARRLSSHHGELCKFFCSQTGRDLDFFGEVDTRGGEQMLNMIDMCTAFAPDAVVFQTLFEVLPGTETVQKLMDALRSLKRAAVGEQISKDKKICGVRDVRNKLFHEFLMVDPTDFEILATSSRRILGSIHNIVSCLNGSHSSVYADAAASAIDDIISKDLRVVSLNDAERTALQLQQGQMLEQLHKVEEEKKQVQASLLNLHEKHCQLQQRLLFFNAVGAGLPGHWAEPMRKRAGDAQPEI